MPLLSPKALKGYYYCYCCCCCCCCYYYYYYYYHFPFCLNDLHFELRPGYPITGFLHWLSPLQQNPINSTFLELRIVWAGLVTDWKCSSLLKYTNSLNLFEYKNYSCYEQQNSQLQDYFTGSSSSHTERHDSFAVWDQQIFQLPRVCQSTQRVYYWLTRCMALPSMMAARCVGQNSGPVFRRLWTKLRQIKFACAEVSVVCNAVFRLTTSCCVPDIFMIKSQSCVKSRQKWMFSGKFRGRGHPNFWPNFINLGQHRTRGKVWWRSAKQSWRLGGEKRKI